LVALVYIPLALKKWYISLCWIEIIEYTDPQPLHQDRQSMNLLTSALLLSLPALILVSCAPIPMIQSSRVTGRFGVGVSYTSQSHTINETNTFECTPGTYCDSTGKRTSTFDVSDQIEPRTYFRFGIRNRVELLTSIQPSYFVYLSIKGNLKVALFELGREQLFRNIAVSIFSGGDAVPAEWEKYRNAWAGLITGTHHDLTNANIDLELVSMIYGSYFSIRTHSDGYPSRYLSYKTANLSLGCIMRPIKHGFLEFNTGVTFREYFDKRNEIRATNLYSTYSTSEITRFSVEPVIFQMGVQIYIPDRKKKTEEH
jgi:hypothetical protein